MKTPKETFQEELLNLGLTKLQVVSLKMLGAELARDEWLRGYERHEDIVKSTSSILK